MFCITGVIINSVLRLEKHFLEQQDINSKLESYYIEIPKGILIG